MRKTITAILAIVLGTVALCDAFFGIFSSKPHTNAELTYRTVDEPEAVQIAQKEKEIKEAIQAGNLVIGMTRRQVRSIPRYSNPDDISVLHGNWGEHTQYIYRNGTCLYFENGILTSWLE